MNKGHLLLPGYFTSAQQNQEQRVAFFRYMGFTYCPDAQKIIQDMKTHNVWLGIMLHYE